MIFGTFDGLHKGHINFFKQAKKLSKNPYLIVSVARDFNVKKIKKSLPEFSEKKRVDLIKKTKLAQRVLLGGIKNHLPHIVKEKPDIIALGYDQRQYVKNLKNDLTQKGIDVRIVRLKSFKPHIYKNRLLKKQRTI